MKNFLKISLILALVISLGACGGETSAEEEKEPSGNWTSASESEQEQEITPDPENIPQEDKYYFADFLAASGSYTPSDFVWNDNSTLTFQDGDCLTTLDENNSILRYEFFLPNREDFENIPALFRGGKYVFASSRDGNGGYIHGTYGGKIFFSDLTVYENEEVYTAPMKEEDISGIKFSRAVSRFEGETFDWVDENRAYISFYYAVGLYDFEKAEGNVLWEAKEYKKEIGAKVVDYNGGDVLGNKFYFCATEYIENEKDGDEYIWVCSSSGAERLFPGRIAFCDGENLVIKREDGIYLITVNNPDPVKICSDPLHYDEFHSEGDRINFGNGVTNGKEKIFYSYKISTGELETFPTGYTSSITFLGALEKNGVPEYYLIDHEKGILWHYDSEKGYCVNVYEGSDLNSGDVSPNLRLIAEHIEEDGRFKVRVKKIISEEEIPAYQKEFTPDQLRIFNLRYKNTSFTPEDFYADPAMLEEFLMEYKTVTGWLELSEKEIAALAPKGDFFRKTAPCGNRVYLAEYSDYSPAYYHIWYDPETGDAKIMGISYLSDPEVFFVGDTLISYGRERISAFDMKTGEEIPCPIDFPFGYKGYEGTEKVIVGMGYDEKAKRYVIAYEEWFLRDPVEGTARVNLGVYTENGKLEKTVDTGTDMQTGRNSYFISASSVSFPEEGVIALTFQVGSGEQDIKELRVDYSAAENKKSTELSEIWDKFAGTWRSEAENSAVTFYKWGDDFAFGKDSHLESGFTAKAKAVTKITSSLWEITLSNKNGEFSLFVDTATPGDSKIEVRFSNKTPVEYTFQG